MHQTLASELTPSASPKRDNWDYVLIVSGSLGLGLSLAIAAALGLLETV